MIDREKLISYAQQYSIAVSGKEAELLDGYCGLLVEKNRFLNLTAITEPDDVLVKHVLDSLLCADMPYIRGSVADVGTGGGFPGVPVKIHRPECSVTLIDATGKKLDFIRESCSALGLDVECVHGRAEEIGRRLYREKFDTVTARAVAALPVLCELCLPLVKVGGYFIAMKGTEGEAELKAAERAVSLLGGESADTVKLQLPGDAGERTLIAIRKIKHTPDVYPRGGNNIVKKPL